MESVQSDFESNLLKTSQESIKVSKANKARTLQYGNDPTERVTSIQQPAEKRPIYIDDESGNGNRPIEAAPIWRDYQQGSQRYADSGKNSPNDYVFNFGDYKKKAAKGVNHSQNLASTKSQPTKKVMKQNFTSLGNHIDEEKVSKKSRGRAKMPAPSSIDRNERKAMVEQQLFDSMMSKAESLPASVYEKLDHLDREALRRWYANAKQFANGSKEKRTVKTDVRRVVDLYKLYGSDQSALVNPSSDKLSLEVRNRSTAEARQLD